VLVPTPCLPQLKVRRIGQSGVLMSSPHGVLSAAQPVAQ